MDGILFVGGDGGDGEKYMLKFGGGGFVWVWKIGLEWNGFHEIEMR